ncbi:MAG: dimethyl sulfoxide reductase anchor subunit family protein [Methyloligellaceae bacterium]
MHPAYSVILFTTASGAGYGLLGLLAVLGPLGVLPAERWFGFAGFALALGLISAGLLTSTAHLGRPERAWRAFSQWRSSWLSREGVMAVATYAPAGLLAIGWVFFETAAGAWAVAGWLTAICAALTVYCTGMIYGSLRTIRQWHHPLVTPVYLLLAAATGAICLNLLMQAFGLGSAWAAWTALASLAVAALVKIAYWVGIDHARASYTAERATGLGRFGTVRPLEPPHTQPNYVMREMGYQVARKHAQRLRRLAVLFGFLVPMAAMGAILAGTGPALLWAVVATASAGLGVVIERWLFFAEAKHVVMVYYGAEAA